MYALLCICLALTALLATNAAASALAAAVWRVLAPRVASLDSASRARLLFALRASPPAAAATLAFALVVPAYLLHEPADSGERVGAWLLLLACASSAGVALAAWRAARSCLATRRLARDWMRQAEPLPVEGACVPAYGIRHRFPIVAVVGVLRPRLFIASQVLDALTPGELAAALAHERAHVLSRDNLKRALLQAGEDALLRAPLGGSLRRAWQRESEMAADEFAVAAGGPEAALDLASAVVKLSKLIPAGARPTLPAGAHLLGESRDCTSRRVRNLLRLASSREAAHGLRARPTRATLLCRCACAAAAPALAHPEVLRATHAAIEHVVEHLA